MRKIISILFLLFITITAFAQKHERPLVQFSGIVYNSDSTKVVVPYVNVSNSVARGQVTQSGFNGYFSFVVHEQDTLRFTSVGYASTMVVIPANLQGKSYVMRVLLKPQIINLPVFRVFPWATTEEFTKEFISMKVADDDLEIARKNVNRSALEAAQRTLPRDGPEIGSFQDFHNSVLNSHSITNPLLNPFNWGTLVKEISDGDRSRAAMSTSN